MPRRKSKAMLVDHFTFIIRNGRAYIYRNGKLEVSDEDHVLLPEALIDVVNELCKDAVRYQLHGDTCVRVRVELVCKPRS